MIARFAARMLLEPDKRVLVKFLYTFGWKGMRAVNAFKKRIGRGEYYPAFLFLSLTNDCNLRCQGCWVSPTRPARELDLQSLERILSVSKENGSYFFGILGGEPLLHPGLFELMAAHPECYFQVFTNGTLLTDEVAGRMRRLGNVSPLISVEGREAVGDERRGGTGIFKKAMEGIGHCRRNGLITGVATSICKSNIDELATGEFVDELVARGVHYLWYYIYRPVGSNPMPELALSPEEITRLRRFIVEIRGKAPMAIIDAYWDQDGGALCPAAVGISHHIGPGGDIEPCPPIQFARENVGDGENFYERIAHSDFLAGFRKLAAGTTKGCILMERPDLLREFMVREEASDSSGRDSGLGELEAMLPHLSHHLPAEEIPEKHWLYRFAKKNWFFGFGAYG